MTSLRKIALRNLAVAVLLSIAAERLNKMKRFDFKHLSEKFLVNFLLKTFDEIIKPVDIWHGSKKFKIDFNGGSLSNHFVED